MFEQLHKSLRVNSRLLPSAWAWARLSQLRAGVLASAVRRFAAQAPEAPASPGLDLGCGAGDYLVAALRAQPHRAWLGIDRDASLLAALQAYAHRHRLTPLGLLQADLNDGVTPLPTGPFDRALCLAMLQYVADDIGLLRQLSQRMTPGGILLLYLPVNYHRIIPGYEALMARLFARYDYDAAQGICRRYTESSVAQLLADSGWHVTHQQRVGGLPGRLQYELQRLLQTATQAWLWPAPLLLAWLPLGWALMALDGLHGRLYPRRSCNGLLVWAEPASDLNTSIMAPARQTS